DPSGMDAALTLPGLMMPDLSGYEDLAQYVQSSPGRIPWDQPVPPGQHRGPYVSLWTQYGQGPHGPIIHYPSGGYSFTPGPDPGPQHNFLTDLSDAISKLPPRTQGAIYAVAENLPEVMGSTGQVRLPRRPSPTPGSSNHPAPATGGNRAPN